MLLSKGLKFSLIRTADRMSLTGDVRTNVVTHVCCANVPFKNYIKDISDCLHLTRQGWLFRQIKGGSFVFRAAQRQRSEYITPGQDRHLQMSATLKSNQYGVYNNTPKYRSTKAISVFNNTHRNAKCEHRCCSTHTCMHIIQSRDNNTRSCTQGYWTEYPLLPSEMSHICWELCFKLLFPFPLCPSLIGIWTKPRVSCRGLTFVCLFYLFLVR